jgi:broad specificity phosphatase PhoE
VAPRPEASGSLRAYFLRHAESVSNANLGVVAMPPERGDRLTDQGRGQAAAAGRYLADNDLGIQKVFTSPMRRARETAEAVAGEVGLPVEKLEDSQELRESEGYGEMTPEAQRLHRWSVWMTEHGSDPDYSWHGGESFNELIGRVRAVKASLESLAGECDAVLAVSHGIFLRFFLLECLLGDAFDASQVGRLWQVRTANCGLSLFEFLPGEPDEKDPSEDPWRCVTWMARPWDPP